MGGLCPLVALACISSCAYGQPSGDRMAPDLLRALEQVTARFSLSLGIEYRLNSETTKPISLPIRAKNAAEAVASVVSQVNGYGWRIEKGVVHVFDRKLVSDPRNPLNIVLSTYRFGPSNTKMASSLLMQEVLDIVRPRIGRGRGGSFPGGVGEPIIELKTRQAPVRRYLNELVRVGTAPIWVICFPENEVLTPAGYLEVAGVEGSKRGNPLDASLWGLRLRTDPNFSVDVIGKSGTKAAR